MTRALTDALTKHRHLKGERVLYGDDNQELTNKVVRAWLERAQKAAGIDVTGAIHRLRHYADLRVMPMREAVNAIHRGDLSVAVFRNAA